METNEKPKLEEAGAFWIKTSKTGTQFLTGKVKSKSGEEISVMVFKNKYKTEGSNQPDYRIYFDNGVQKSNSGAVTAAVAAAVSKTESAAPKTSKAAVKKEAPKTEEIPF
jgi:uncharacterized protein (DUF736 family)